MAHRKVTRREFVKDTTVAAAGLAATAAAAGAADVDTSKIMN